MSTISYLDQYTKKAQEDGHSFLGRIVFFCQFDAIVRWQELKDALDAVGLGAYAPRKPGLADLFRRVSTAAQRKRIDLGDGRYVNILVRDVASEETELLRRVVSETVDSQGKRLDYREEYDLVFDRESETVTTSKRTFTPSAADDVVTEITANFARLQGTVDASAVRVVVSRALKAHHAISARPTGGADFVLEEHAAIVDALETLPDKIPGCWIHSIPLIDDDKQRSYVQAQVEDDTTSAIDSALTEMRKLIAAGEDVSSAKFAALNTTFKQLKERAAAYTELLGVQLDGTKTRLDIYNATMAQLSQHVRAAA